MPARFPRTPLRDIGGSTRAGMQPEVLDDFQDLSGWMPVASGLAELGSSPSRGPRGAAHAPRLRLQGRRRLRRRAQDASPGRCPRRSALELRDPRRGAGEPARAEARRPERAERLVAALGRLRAARANGRRSRVREPRDRVRVGTGGRRHARASSARSSSRSPRARAAPGRCWIADLRLEDRTYRAHADGPRLERAPGHAAGARARRRPGDRAGAASRRAGTQRLEVDFGEEREYGGLVIHWEPGARPRRSAWRRRPTARRGRRVHAAEPADVERSFVYLPGDASRFLRARPRGRAPAGCGIAELEVQPFEFSRSIEAFFEHVARERAARPPSALARRRAERTGRRSASPTATPARS